MGLFDVNMPLLYGEGEKAFIRLQEEILKRSNDHSLFAWTAPKPIGIDEIKPFFGGFPTFSPSYFERGNQYFAQYRNSPLFSLKTPYSMTNMGLSIDVPLFEVPGNCFIAVLLCGSPHAKNSFTGLRVSVQNLSRLQKRGFRSGPKSFSGPGIAKRDFYMDPIPLKVIEIGHDNSVPWVKVDWDDREVKAYVTKLYIPQVPLYGM